MPPIARIHDTSSWLDQSYQEDAACHPPLVKSAPSSKEEHDDLRRSSSLPIDRSSSSSSLTTTVLLSTSSSLEESIEVHLIVEDDNPPSRRTVSFNDHISVFGSVNGRTLDNPIEKKLCWYSSRECRTMKIQSQRNVDEGDDDDFDIISQTKMMSHRSYLNFQRGLHKVMAQNCVLETQLCQRMDTPMEEEESSSALESNELDYDWIADEYHTYSQKCGHARFVALLCRREYARRQKHLREVRRRNVLPNAHRVLVPMIE